MQNVLPLLLFPPISWWTAALRHEAVISLATLTTRVQPINRYTILTANGPQQLSVPLLGGRRQRVPLAELRIDHTHSWQRQHWGALYSAYGRAPFFEHYGPALEAIVAARHERLGDLSNAALQWLAAEMRVTLAFSDVPVSEIKGRDGAVPQTTYHQVFGDRWGFVPDLSVIDLLMNEGPHAVRIF